MARIAGVDLPRGKRIEIRIAGETFTLPASAPNGHFRGVVRLKREAAEAAWDRKTRWLCLRAVTRAGDERVFSGEVQLLEENGLSVISDIDDRVDGARVLEAGGHVVTPGFIDIHTHYDAQVFWDPALTPSSWHGVTTVIAGNCGYSIAPCKPADREWVVRLFAQVEGMTPSVLEQGLPWDWESFPQLMDVLDERLGINVGIYVGHSAIRRFVMGDAASEREANDGEIQHRQRDAMLGSHKFCSP